MSLENFTFIINKIRVLRSDQGSSESYFDLNNLSGRFELNETDSGRTDQKELRGEYSGETM